jgi:hypothetical protein
MSENFTSSSASADIKRDLKLERAKIKIPVLATSNVSVYRQLNVCGNKMPTRCNRGFYCRFYCLLNMFRPPLCPSSGAQEYYTVVAASAPHQTNSLKTTAPNTTGSNQCIILLSSL